MLFTRSTEYAWRALVFIAESGNGPLRTAEIAEALDVPRNYLSKILHQLARADVLQSVRGPRGGFTLAVPAESLTLGQALSPIEAERIDKRCLLGRPECRDAHPCPAHEEWKSLREHLSRFLEETTIADLSRRDADGADWPH